LELAFALTYRGEPLFRAKVRETPFLLMPLEKGPFPAMVGASASDA